MGAQSAFAACEDEVRRHDPDRYFAALFAPEKKRRHLFALYAFYRELAHAVEAEEHADATSGTLMRLAACVLGTEANGLAREAGIAYALAGRSGGRYSSIDTTALAKKHLDAARRLPMPRAALPAVLPAALVPLYLKRNDPPLWRKQITYLRTSWRGRI